MKKLPRLIACLLLIPLTGCVPVLIGGMFHQDAAKRKSRQRFTDSFRTTNLEREKAGLDPLDICFEKYQYDRKWAKVDPECRKRIKRYEAGDLTAMNIGDGEKQDSSR